MPATATTDFVPADLDASRWSNLEPLYRALLERDLKCAGCLERLLLDRSELDAAASEAHANCYIAMTCHTDDDEAKQAYLSFVEDVEPELRRVGHALDERIVDSPHLEGLDEDRYGVLLRDLRADVANWRDESVALMTQDTKLGQRFAEISGAMTVVFEGEARTMPQMTIFLQETDRARRERAWRGMAVRRLEDRDDLDGVFDDMVALRHRIARNAGHTHYRDWVFIDKHRFDYTPADCEAFHAAAEATCVPILRRLDAERATLLAVDSLRPWDLDVDVHGRAPLRPFDGGDALVAGSSRLFHRLDERLGTMFDRLRDGTCLDLETRPAKAPGGYQWERDRSRKPFIFMNAAGMQRDLSTMIHESGHAFHSMQGAHDPLLAYRHPPIEFAEVASMGMEMLAFPHLGEFYDETQANRARRSELIDIVRTMSWVSTIDAFQHWLYTHPDHDRGERTAAWLALDDRFGAAVDWGGLEDFRASAWQRQLHLFQVPFYYIEYGIAMLGALQLWLQARRDPARAVERYLAALALGGSRPLPALFEAAGLEFRFDADMMGRCMEAVEAELEALPA